MNTGMSFRNAIPVLCCASALAFSGAPPCHDLFRTAPHAVDGRFSVNAQSSDVLVRAGTPTELLILVQNGRDYRISFVYDGHVVGDHVDVRLIECVRPPKAAGAVRKDERTVLWDNADHDHADAIEFTATSTKRIAVQVTARAMPGGEDVTGCVGILIEHMPTKKVGF